MSETNMTIKANNMDDAFKALAYARRHFLNVEIKRGLNDFIYIKTIKIRRREK